LRPIFILFQTHKKAGLKSPALIILSISIYEQPLVLPQPSQTKQEPAILILTPQVIQSGASDFKPVRDSRTSMEDLASTFDFVFSTTGKVVVGTKSVAIL
jgi:hypothetical protein